MHVNQRRKFLLLLLLSAVPIFTFICYFHWPGLLECPNLSAAICTRSTAQCVPPFRPFEKRFRVAPCYRLNFCAIEKNMSTVLTAIICFLFDEQLFRESGRKINKELFHRRLCKGRNEVFSMAALAARFNLSAKAIEGDDWLHLAIVREPVDRFLSAFVDKCVLERTWQEYPERCNGCRNNMSCFIERQFDRMQRRGWRAERLNSFDDRHFFPQNWRCQFNDHFRHFTFIRYSPTAEGVDHFFAQLFAILRQRGVSEASIAFIRNQTAQGRTPHTTWQSKQRKKGETLLRQNPRLMRLLVRMYFYDFTLFGYPIPGT